MAHKICYWDEVDGCQKERDATPEEASEIDARIASNNVDDLRAKNIRIERNSLLAASDWTQVIDNPIANKDAWAAYRQELRDITNQPSFPSSVTWPVAPT